MKREVIFLLILSLFTFLLFLNIIDNFFFGGDDIARVKFGLKGKLELKSFIYDREPLFFNSFLLLAPLFGLNPRPYHLCDILLHILNVFLVYFLAKLLLKKIFNEDIHRWGAFLCALIFACIFCHYEAIIWISANASLYTFFFLISLISFIQYHEKKKLYFLLLSLTSFILSILTHVTPITLPIILFIVVILFYEIKSVKSLAPYIFIVIIYFFFHKGDILQTPAKLEGTGNKLYDIFLIYYYYLSEILLSTFGIIRNTYIRLQLSQTIFPIIVPYFQGLIIVSILGILVTSYIMGYKVFPQKRKKGKKKKKSKFSIINFVKENLLIKSFIFTLIFILITFFPHTLISKLIPQQTPLHVTRYLYLPSVGFSLFLGLLLFWLYQKVGYIKFNKGMIILVIISIISINSMLTYRIGDVWGERGATFEKLILRTCRVCKENETKNKTKGTLYMVDPPHSIEWDYAPEFADAVNLFCNTNLEVKWVKEKELSKFEDDIDINNSFFIRFETNKYGDATSYYRTILSKGLDPEKYRKILPYLEKANGHLNDKAYEEAISYYEKVINIYPTFVDAYINLGACYYSLKNYEKALFYYKKAIEIKPNQKDIINIINKINTF